MLELTPNAAAAADKDEGEKQKSRNYYRYLGCLDLEHGFAGLVGLAALGLVGLSLERELGEKSERVSEKKKKTLCSRSNERRKKNQNQNQKRKESAASSHLGCLQGFAGLVGLAALDLVDLLLEIRRKRERERERNGKKTSEKKRCADTAD